MLSSIHPLGERTRGNRWGVTVALFTASAAVGGAGVGAALGAAGSIVVAAGDRWPLAAAAGLGLLALVIDSSGANRDLARPRRQVDEAWLTMYRRWIYATGWGLQLGAGVVTVMPAATVWLVFVLAALSASATSGALLGAVFGLVRGASLLASSDVIDPARLRSFHQRMSTRAGLAHRAATAGDALVVVAASTAALV